MSEAWDGKTERRRQTLQSQQDILARLDQLNGSVEKVVRFIEGNGNPERGAIVRIDRLEQQGEIRQKHIGWLWTAIGGGAVKMVVDWLKKSP